MVLHTSHLGLKKVLWFSILAVFTVILATKLNASPRSASGITHSDAAIYQNDHAQEMVAQAPLPSSDQPVPSMNPIAPPNIPASDTAVLFENQQYAVRVFQENGQTFANVYDKQNQTHQKVPVSITPVADPKQDLAEYIATIGDQQYIITTNPRGSAELTIFQGGTIVYRQSSDQITIARNVPEVSTQPVADNPTRDLVKTIVSNFAKLTIFTLMLSMGLRWTFEDVVWLWKQPSLLARSLFSILIAVPLLGAIFTLIPGLAVAERIAIGAMVACPGAPTIPSKGLKAGGHEKYIASLQFAVCILAVVSVPLVLAILAQFYPNDAWVPPLTIAKQIFLAQVLPLGLGVLLAQYVPQLADDWIEPVSKIANLLFLLLVIILLVISLPKVLSTSFVAGLVMVLMAIASLACGHFLGGPQSETKTVLAYATATRNAGLAILLVSLNFPNLDYFKGGMINTLISYALITAIVAIPYTGWRKRSLTASSQTA